jgi:hypothetical protein
MYINGLSPSCTNVRFAKQIKELIVHLHLFQNNTLKDKCVFAIVIYNEHSFSFVIDFLRNCLRQVIFLQK